MEFRFYDEPLNYCKQFVCSCFVSPILILNRNFNIHPVKTKSHVSSYSNHFNYVFLTLFRWLQLNLYDFFLKHYFFRICSLVEVGIIPFAEEGASKKAPTISIIAWNDVAKPEFIYTFHIFQCSENFWWSKPFFLFDRTVQL